MRPNIVNCRSPWRSNRKRATLSAGVAACVKCWAVRGRGKSGGIRVIYYLVADEEIYFLFAYAKNQQEDLDSGQLRILRNLVREEFK
jgi:hypothetical protein